MYISNLCYSCYEPLLKAKKKRICVTLFHMIVFVFDKHVVFLKKTCNVAPMVSLL
ncbi:hypothetical protein BD560DRAFT_398240 [Blakeslea trispora]|nr:hypothetical protein BD560DRAFT_398240 [Blakeslea trispora]